MFGTNLAQWIPKRKDYNQIRIISLADPVASPPDNEQAASEGWYIRVEYVCGGAVIDYYISNSHMK
jgi:hypothetical protein